MQTKRRERWAWCWNMQHISQNVRVSPHGQWTSHKTPPKQTVIEKPLHDTQSRHDDEDVLVMTRKWERKWLHEDPRSVTYDGFGSLKSGRNQALCWKAETVPTCQHSPSSQIASDIIVFHNVFLYIYYIYTQYAYLFTVKTSCDQYCRIQGCQLLWYFFSIPRA